MNTTKSNKNVPSWAWGITWGIMIISIAVNVISAIL
jgi:hypothetical protein